MRSFKSTEETVVSPHYALPRRFREGDPLLADHQVCADGWPCDTDESEVCPFSPSHAW